MVRRLLRILCLVVVLISTSVSAIAQFYSTGRGRASIRWNEIDSTHFMIVYPAGYQEPALRMALLLDSIHPYIGWGINFPIQKVPIIVHTDNMLSNGYVTWAPKRAELVIAPPADNYALLWSKHLPIHEWRHVAQISALRRGVTKIASWFFGQGGVGLGLLVTPRWILEGDATIAETQFAEFGRGVQPEFTVEYRAMFADGRKSFRRLDPWICGSYKRHYPDIYKFGYQTLSAAHSYLGVDYFGRMLAYTGRWPIFVMPADIYLHHKHQTTFKKIARRAFAQLDSLWAPYAELDENFTLSVRPNKQSYTLYGYPIDVGGRILALRGDYDTPTRLVDLRSGRTVKNMGYVTSRLIEADGKVYFTEYLPHPIYEQVSFSAIRVLDPRSGKIKTFDPRGRNYFITPIHKGFASVSVDDQSRSYIKFFDSRMELIAQRHFGGRQITVHGLAFDSVTGTLAFIALDQRGMWIGAFDGAAVRQLTAPSVVTVSDLSAGGGRLYFSSIQSGKNEIHSLDLSTRIETQLTRSRFGSSMPMVGADSLRFTTYRAEGVIAASIGCQSEPVDTVEWSRRPANLLNIEWVKWGVPVVDSMDFDSRFSADTVSIKPERENRFREPFAIHTWAPVAFDGDFVMEGRPMAMTFGVTAFFQTALSKVQGYLSYGWLNNRNWLKGRVLYTGLPLNISVGAQYGGGDQSVLGAPAGVVRPKRDLYLSADLTLSLPLNFSSGGFSRLLQPSFSVTYDNSILYDYQKQGFRHGGFAQYGVWLWFSNSRSLARRNITSRLAYAVRFNVNGSFSADFATLYSLYARANLPGVAKNHSITLAVGGQVQDVKTYNFSSKPLYLKGVSDPYASSMYFAGQVDYALPIACPDWGWEGVVYLSRIRANLFAGFAAGRYLTGVAGRYLAGTSYTYGVDVSFDFTLLRAYAQSMTFTFAAPSDKGFYFGFSYGIGLF